MFGRDGVVRAQAGGETMKIKSSSYGSVNELHFELKYCERCGGLWLRPAMGSQVYCAACAGEMEKLPAARGTRSARLPGEPSWAVRRRMLQGNGVEDKDGVGDAS